VDEPLAWATNPTPAVAAAVVEQHAPRVTSAIIAGVRPAIAPVAVGRPADAFRTRIRWAPRKTATAIPRPTPIDTRTIAMVAKNGSSMNPHGASMRRPG